jgi:hypothetical protein
VLDRLSHFMASEFRPRVDDPRNDCKRLDSGGIIEPIGACGESAKACAAGVDTTLRSTGGARPLAPGEVARPVTSGDVIKMYSKHSEGA